MRQTFKLHKLLTFLFAACVFVGATPSSRGHAGFEYKVFSHFTLVQQAAMQVNEQMQKDSPSQIPQITPQGSAAMMSEVESQIEDALNELGADGWELVTARRHVLRSQAAGPIERAPIWGGLIPNTALAEFRRRKNHSAMVIRELIGPQDRVEHIAKHGIRPHDVEEVCFGHPLVLRARSEDRNPVYYVLGRTIAGQYLFCVVIQFPKGNGYPVTARPMTDAEKRRFKQRKR